jgi:hypothetical protein
MGLAGIARDIRLLGQHADLHRGLFGAQEGRNLLGKMLDRQLADHAMAA